MKIKNTKIYILSVLLFFLLSIFFLVSYKNNKKSEKKILNVYNYGDYIDEDVLKIFTDKTGIKINYDTFATSEDAYTKIKNGGTNYDIVIITDYMVERMINENLISPLDFSMIKNYSYIHNRFKNLEFDPDNKFSVPYMWGTVGILYNKAMIPKPNSWQSLWNKKYKNQIFMYDSQRDAIGITLKKLGYSINTRSIKELQEVKSELIKQKKIIQAYVSDAVKDKMIGREGAIAVSYSGDALFCQKENSDLDYVIPIEGSNLWVDSIVIPKNAEHKNFANKFIDFLCEPEIALLNTEYIGYSTVNSETLKKLPDKIKNNKIYWPSDQEFKRCEIFHDLGNFIKQYDLIWTEILADD